MPNPPKPIERRRKTGNPSKRKLPEPRSVVSALEIVPPPPPGLGKAGLVVWRRVWDAGSDWLAPGDVTILEMLCRQVDEIDRWQQILDAEGVTFTTRNGFIRIHPAVAQIRELEHSDHVVEVSFSGGSRLETAWNISVHAGTIIGAALVG